MCGWGWGGGGGGRISYSVLYGEAVTKRGFEKGCRKKKKKKKQKSARDKSER